jgi:hypothetical protein
MQGEAMVGPIALPKVSPPVGVARTAINATTKTMNYVMEVDLPAPPLSPLNYCGHSRRRIAAGFLPCFPRGHVFLPLPTTVLALLLLHSAESLFRTYKGVCGECFAWAGRNSRRPEDNFRLREE